jgi:hypothetical protein
MVNGTEFGKLHHGSVYNQFCYSQFIASHTMLSKQSKHVQAAIKCNQGQGTDAVRAHTSLRHYVEGSKSQLDQRFRLQTFIHSSNYTFARSLSPIGQTAGYSACMILVVCIVNVQETPDFGTS